MMRRRWVRYALATLGIAAASYFGAMALAPSVIMSRVMDRLATQAGGVNRIGLTAPPDANSRQVVKPSPDLAYAVCVFDLAEGPVLVGGRPADAYWSLALYGANTDNFFVVNDRSPGAGGGRFVLANAAMRARIPAEFRALTVIEPPSAKGIMLQRYLVLDPGDLTSVRAAQADAVCRRL